MLCLISLCPYPNSVQLFQYYNGWVVGWVGGGVGGRGPGRVAEWVAGSTEDKLNSVQLS